MPPIRDSNGGIEPDEEDLDHFENEEEESGSGDDQEDEEESSSSEMDFEECDRRKTEYMDDMTELSQQFCKIKDQLFNEREALIDLKLQDIRQGTDQDYLLRLKHQEQVKQHRLLVADILIDFRREALQEIFKSEELANLQNMENDKDILYDQLKHDLEDKIRRLEEDRHSIDIRSDLYAPLAVKKQKHHNSHIPGRLRKPVVVTGPYIVYRLEETDLINDWTLIKQATKHQSQRRKVEL